jgi:hypothetical protein
MSSTYEDGKPLTDLQRVHELEEMVDDLELRYLQLKNQRGVSRPLAPYEYIIGWLIIMAFLSAIFTIGFLLGTMWHRGS